MEKGRRAACSDVRFCGWLFHAASHPFLPFGCRLCGISLVARAPFPVLSTPCVATSLIAQAFQNDYRKSPELALDLKLVELSWILKDLQTFFPHNETF